MQKFKIILILTVNQITKVIKKYKKKKFIFYCMKNFQNKKNLRKILNIEKYVIICIPPR